MNPSPPQPATLAKPAGRDKRAGLFAGTRPWALALFTLVMLGVTWGSLTPNAPSLRVTNIDKAQHLGAYALLAALAYAACRRRSWRVALALIGFGVAIEFAQAALADGRDGSALDGLANGAGVLLVSLGWRRRALR